MTSHVKIAIEAFLDVWNTGDVEILDAALSPAFVFHLPPYGEVVGVQSMKEYVTALLEALPDFYVWTNEIIADEDTVVVRWKYHATHTGSSYTFPYPPTGKELEVIGCSIIHTSGEVIADVWHFVDNLGLLQQLELLPVSVPA